jgi:hypothetical protein
MPRPLQVDLSADQRASLLNARDHHPKPYIREQAAAILRVADGHSARQVARDGILKPRCRETIVLWVSRFLSHGIDGLLVRPGRGRKPAFCPSAPKRSSSTPSARLSLACLTPLVSHARAGRLRRCWPPCRGCA